LETSLGGIAGAKIFKLPPHIHTMNYNLELDKVSDKINQEKAKLVCIQLPDGLKPNAQEIVDHLEQKTKAKVLIHAGSCFGACDLPTGLESVGVDLLIQFGHAEKGWVKQKTR